MQRSCGRLLTRKVTRCISACVPPKRHFLYDRKRGFDRDTIATLQWPIDLRQNALQHWYKQKQYKALLKDNRYLPERHGILGPDLATAHFIVRRGAAVKFVNHSNWIKLESLEDEIPLPNVCKPDLKLEAVDASNTEIMYESLDNFRELQQLVYLNISGCKRVDDWFLDRLSQYRDTLLVLNLSGCSGITERGLASLHRLKNLRRLKLADLPQVRHKHLLCLMLEENLPECVLEGVDLSGDPTDYDLEDEETIPEFLKQWQTYLERQSTTSAEEKSSMWDVLKIKL